jgi:thiamine-phosphate pyrophosphorylase
LHVITDVVVQSRFSHEALAELACAGGADVIQLRDKSLDAETMLAVARRVQSICERHGATLIVNDQVEVAVAVGAGGVHLGRSDAPIGDVRRRAGETFIIGASAGSRDEAVAAERAGADYVGVGHVFATTSKVKAGPPIGLDGLAAVCAAVSIPVIAIGGITPENAASAVDAGAWGVAVISAVCSADDPRAAATRLRARIAAT